MEIKFQEKYYSDEMRKFSLKRDFGDNLHLQVDILLGSEKFLEYQKDIFKEYISKIIDLLTDADALHLGLLQKHFETTLQNLNAKLQLFAEKINQVDKFPIKGIIQIFFEENYLASMIGDVSIIIYRNGQLNDIVYNIEQENQKINIFSDIVEGSLEHKDKIICVGLNIQDIMEKKEIEEIIQISESEENNIISLLEDVICIRINKDEIGLITVNDLENKLSLNKQILAKKQSHQFNWDMIEKLKNIILQNRYPIVVSILILIIIFLIYSFFIDNSFKKNTVVTPQGVVVDNLTIEDIKKELDQFKKIDKNNNEKIKKYQEINQKIAILEQQNKWTFEIQELKKLINEEYYKGFNIILIDSIQNNSSLVYKFDDTEKQTIGNLNYLGFGDGYMVGGDKGAILGIVSEKIRGKIIGYNLPTGVKGCKDNLQKNGLYCYANEKNIFNIKRSGLENITSKSGLFPTNIIDISTYKDTNMYVLTNDQELNKKGVYLIRYEIVSKGNQINFKEGFNYKIEKNFAAQEKTFFNSGLTNLTIDNTFLIWSRNNKEIVQLRREKADQVGNLNGRKISLVGGSNEILGNNSNYKIITNSNTEFIYLFDKTNQILSVYRTAPLKTNDSFEHTYKVLYLFSIKFILKDNKIDDIYIKLTTKPELYLLNSDGIHMIKLYEFIESFIKK